MEYLTLISFCAILIIFVAADIPLIYALLAGLAVFCLYGLRKGFSPKELGGMLLSGIKTIKNILLVFVLIGMLTALWRACGTISVLVCYTVQLIRPGTLVLMAFLLNCLVSVLTGTSFGTAATMGVICMTMANSMGENPVLVGGAILSGCYFGDRCSPVSTSALLVSELTCTQIFDNIKKMLRTALLPFIITCIAYGAMGFFVQGDATALDLRQLFGRELMLHWTALLPAAILLVLSLLRVNVKLAMLASIAAALPLCLFLQHDAIGRTILLLWRGFTATDVEVGVMLNGGGITSMFHVAAIVCISSTYAGIFQGTGLLDSIQEHLLRLSKIITPYGGILVTSVITALLACNQTLTIMLTRQLCRDVLPDGSDMAIALEDSAVVVAPLIPWSIAGAAPLALISAPTASLLASCFLYLLPLYRLAASQKKIISAAK